MTSKINITFFFSILPWEMLQQANKIITKALRMNAIGCIEAQAGLMSANLLNTLREQFVVCSFACYSTAL
jgi:hypothetical protein